MSLRAEKGSGGGAAVPVAITLAVSRAEVNRLATAPLERQPGRRALAPGGARSRERRPVAPAHPRTPSPVSRQEPSPALGARPGPCPGAGRQGHRSAAPARPPGPGLGDPERESLLLPGLTHPQRPLPVTFAVARRCLSADEVLEAARSGEVDALLAFDLHRLARDRLLSCAGARVPLVLLALPGRR